MKIRFYLILLRLGSRLMRCAVIRLSDFEPFHSRWRWIAELIGSNHTIVEALEMDLNHSDAIKKRRPAISALKKTAYHG